MKQHLAAIRVLCDRLVVSQNPAGESRRRRAGTEARRTKGSTPVLSAEEASALLDGIDVPTLVGLRDRALIGVIVYSFARVSVVVGMRRGDYFSPGPARLAQAPRKRGEAS